MYKRQAAQGFEEVNIPDSFFDGVIGNEPLGDFKVSDKRYDKYNFLITIISLQNRLINYAPAV